jgi:predicted NBD/HSP70 family sugar kinase
MGEKKPDLAKSIDAIRTSTGRLNSTVSDLADTVRELEASLESWGVGVPARVTVDVDHDNAWYVDLVYTRVGQRFRVAVESAELGDPCPSVKPWSDCSRDTKLETITLLPGLVAAIAAAVERRIVAADEAAATVQAMVDRLRREGE